MDGIKTVGVIAVIDVLCTASAPLNFHHLSTLCSAPQVHQSGTQIQSESLRLAPPQLCPTSYLVELLPCTASPYTCHLHLHLPPTPTTHAYTHTYHPRLHPHLPPTPTPTPTTHDYTHTYHLHLHLHLPSLAPKKAKERPSRPLRGVSASQLRPHLHQVPWTWR